MSIKCDAESPSRNTAKRFSADSKTIIEARKMMNVEKTARELAINTLADTLANSSGLYQTITTLPDASKIYYFHDKPTLAESMIVWKLTAEAFGVSTDGGVTYPVGLDASGNAILSKIYAIGIDAEYINVDGTMSGVRIETDSGKIGGLNISENGLASDSDIVSITNTYDIQRESNTRQN